jgi:hypothetical protein
MGKTDRGRDSAMAPAGVCLRGRDLWGFERGTLGRITPGGLGPVPALDHDIEGCPLGMEPPAKVTPDEYARIKASPNPLDPLTAFVMFGCSFGAKWGAGFAGQDPRPGRTSYAHRAKINLKDILGSCLDVEIGCLDFKDLPRPPPETVIYADIPYEGTTPYAGVPPFDHRVFWAYASWWSLCGARVFVSEGSKASPPYRWRVLKRWTIPTYLGGGTGQDREERLYVHQDSPMGRSLINV